MKKLIKIRRFFDMKEVKRKMIKTQNGTQKIGTKKNVFTNGEYFEEN